MRPPDDDDEDSESEGHDAGPGVDGEEADGSGEDTVFSIVCPYCGESDTLAVDPDQPAGSVYVEDCSVCCQPMNVTVVGGLGRRRVEVDRD